MPGNTSCICKTGFSNAKAYLYGDNFCNYYNISIMNGLWISCIFTTGFHMVLVQVYKLRRQFFNRKSVGKNRKAAASHFVLVKKTSRSGHIIILYQMLCICAGILKLTNPRDCFFLKNIA